jgi:hypothetical protein
VGKDRKATVNLVDLKVLVKARCEKDVQSLAQVMVLTQPGNSDAETAFEFDPLVSQAKPEARKKVERGYRRLLAALETGEGVDAAPAAFVHRGQ